MKPQPQVKAPTQVVSPLAKNGDKENPIKKRLFPKFEAIYFVMRAIRNPKNESQVQRRQRWHDEVCRDFLLNDFTRMLECSNLDTKTIKRSIKPLLFITLTWKDNPQSAKQDLDRTFKNVAVGLNKDIFAHINEDIQRLRHKKHDLKVKHGHVVLGFEDWNFDIIKFETLFAKAFNRCSRGKAGIYEIDWYDGNRNALQYLMEHEHYYTESYCSHRRRCRKVNGGCEFKNGKTKWFIRL